MSKVTWNDLHTGTAKELMKTYKLSERGLQQHLHKHLDGASYNDRQRMYKVMYDKFRRR